MANLQFDTVYDNPYKYLSDDILFAVHASRNNIKKCELAEARQEFFSKGQPCFLAPLPTKR